MKTAVQLMQPLLKALDKLGGSGSIDEIYEKVVELEKFDEETLAILLIPAKPGKRDGYTKIKYQLRWVKTFLKKAGYLDNPSHGVWSLTDKGKNSGDIDTREIMSYVQSLYLTPEKSPEEVQIWRKRLKSVLKEIKSDAFERLTQCLLYKLGLVNVEVTGRTSDGGIDGKATVKVKGLMSFHIAFQCKKYKGSVGAPAIRNLRGAIAGSQVDRGLFITTGYFTKAAIEEANRDGVSPIDLIDGDQLADKLKELSLGINTKLVEKVTVDREWFLDL